jgi:hypothetical protein
MSHLMSLLGITLILAIAYALSSDRKAIRLRVVGAAFALQAGFAALVLYVPAGNQLLQGIAAGVSALLSYAGKGTEFLFGKLATDDLGQNFAIQALPVIIFFAALISRALLCRHHAAGDPLDRRRFGKADRGQQGRKPLGRVQHLCRPIGKPLGDPPLSGGADP